MGIFPLSDDVSGIYLMFLCTNFSWPCHLDIRHFDLGGVWWIKLHTSHAHTNFLASYDYPFLSYGWLNLIKLPSHGTVTAHAPCHVTYNRGGGAKWSHFWNPWPKFAYLLCHFRGATTKIKPCNRRKIEFFPLWRPQSSLRMRSITWPVHRGPPKPLVTIFSPKLSIYYTTFMGLRRRLRVVYIGASPC